MTWQFVSWSECVHLTVTIHSIAMIIYVIYSHYISDNNNRRSQRFKIILVAALLGATVCSDRLAGTNTLHLERGVIGLMAW